MFERFTERARRVPVHAQEEARSLRHNYIGTEHLLLGLLHQEEGPAAWVLQSAGLTVENVRDQVVGIVGQAEEPTSGQIPFTPRAKKALELALREAVSLGHNHIDTEHVLLGLLREGEGVAVRILLNLEVDTAKLRDEVIRTLPGPERRPLSEPPSRGVVAFPHQSASEADYRINVGLAPRLRRLLMVAAARALDDGRTETELRDLLLALTRDQEAAALLSRLGVDEASVRNALEAADAPDEPPAASADG